MHSGLHNSPLPPPVECVDSKCLQAPKIKRTTSSIEIFIVHPSLLGFGPSFKTSVYSTDAQSCNTRVKTESFTLKCKPQRRSKFDRKISVIAKLTNRGPAQRRSCAGLALFFLGVILQSGEWRSDEDFFFSRGNFCSACLASP